MKTIHIGLSGRSSDGKTYQSSDVQWDRLGQNDSRHGMPMKRLLLLSALLGLAMPSAQAVPTEIHKKCLKAADYAGCVKVFSGKSTATESQIDKLVKTLKLLPSRLKNTNRRDFYRNIQPFSDALGLVDESELSSEYEKYVLQNLFTVSKLLDEIA